MASAKQGDEDAQYAVGYCYENGLGVEVSISEAAKWYALSAEQGNKHARKALKKLK